MSIWWSLHLRREAASVPLARRLLLGTMETAGVDPDVSFDLSVALSEACANAVEHGGGEGPGEAPGAYQVTAYLDGEKCRIEVADSGPGFPARRMVRRTTQVGATANSTASATPVPAAVSAGATVTVPVTPAPAVTAEGGRGLCLIEQLADHVHFRNRPGRGAVVSFDKILKWREGALLRAM
ncbi:ATP-binding protein [Streptomyces sp. NBC_01317]|uniref:ATP-binding protein n=1 Tax=Streptomyces sp. NBC_01317 TaxID=2903822 RepID=UPI002E104FA6|nr:ATP-binding protein [Streptomyces sp. NBC_01317]